MDLLLRGYLLLGLVAHKAIWEWLRRRSQPSDTTGRARRTPRLSAVKAVKVLILIGLLVQVSVLDLVPIAETPLLLRVIGVVLFAVGWVVAVAGRCQLGSNWSNIEDAGVLESQSVVAHGVYRYIRHPIYTGDLLLLFGLQLALNSWLVIGVVLLAPVVLRMAVREEAMLAERLPGYDHYRTTTKRFIPFVI